MPNYINGKLLLTEEEMPIFRERLIRPNILAAERWDSFLADVERTITVSEVDGGVCIEYSLSEHIPNTMTEGGVNNGT